MNIFQAAGNSARSQIEYCNLVNAARKMISQENKMPAKLAKEKDMSVARLLTNVLNSADNLDQQEIDNIHQQEMWISILKLVAGAAVACADSDNFAGSNAFSLASDILGMAVDVGNILLKYFENAADKDKTQANRKTLGEEQKNISADVAALDQRGKG